MSGSCKGTDCVRDRKLTELLFAVYRPTVKTVFMPPVEEKRIHILFAAFLSGDHRHSQRHTARARAHTLAQETRTDRSRMAFIPQADASPPTGTEWAL